MAELVHLFGNLSIKPNICEGCNTEFMETHSSRYCAVCYATSNQQNLCEECSQVVTEFDTTVCYFHIRQMVNDNAIMFCTACWALISEQCDHGHNYHCATSAIEYINSKYPTLLQGANDMDVQ